MVFDKLIIDIRQGRVTESPHHPKPKIHRNWVYKEALRGVVFVAAACRICRLLVCLPFVYLAYLLLLLSLLAACRCSTWLLVCLSAHLLV